MTIKTEDWETKLGIAFKDKKFLYEALTHRSYLNENQRWAYGNNERLEFLGDAVLELVMTRELFNRFPEKEEGELTAYRAAMVNTKILSRVTQEIGLDEKILVSRGERNDFSKSSRGGESIFADAFEALTGAIYLDRGFQAAEAFIGRFLLPHLDEVLKDGVKDAKSLVQEIAQEKFKVTPTYEVLEESGPAHERLFRVGLYFEKELKSEGEGSSKQEAEMRAAEKLFEKLKIKK